MLDGTREQFSFLLFGKKRRCILVILVAWDSEEQLFDFFQKKVDVLSEIQYFFYLTPTFFL